VLELNELDLYYGNIHAVKSLSLEVRRGELVALLGANGAGKTSTLRAISGMLKPKRGRILFQGQDLTRIGPHQIVGLGLAHCPEGRGVFARISVLENLKIGAYRFNDRQQLRQDLEWVYSLFPILAERRNQTAGTLSGGEQQMLAIGRALMSRPTLLLFDEPSLGLAPLMIETIYGVIAALKKEGKTILLVEQNAYAALEVADRAYVLETGALKLAGSTAELLRDEAVKNAYLGG
jgi:branched-chain amino acid transport system ATP-binding protein